MWGRLCAPVRPSTLRSSGPRFGRSSATSVNTAPLRRSLSTRSASGPFSSSSTASCLLSLLFFFVGASYSYVYSCSPFHAPFLLQSGMPVLCNCVWQAACKPVCILVFDLFVPICCVSGSCNTLFSISPSGYDCLCISILYISLPCSLLRFPQTL